jgi:serine/threonine-protein kinase HipA
MILPPTVQVCKVFWHVPITGDKTHKIPVGTMVRSHEGHLYFAYHQDWLSKGIEISPGFLPLENGIVPVSLTDPQTPGFAEDPDVQKEFRGLPGPFYDSLPDKWGMRLIANYTDQDPDGMDPIEILCHRGNRCMGAFSYEPAKGSASSENLSPETLDLYCQNAAKLSAGKDPDTLGKSIMDALEDSGGSAGGMRPKMLLAIHDDDLDENTPTLRKLAGYDHEDMPPDFQPWLLKFDTEPEQYRGPIEQACALMARAAGVTMSETKLIRTKSVSGVQHSHFTTLRFDREKIGKQWHRVHMHTAAGLLRKDFNKLDLDYNELLALTQLMTKDPAQVRQVYTRAVFNVLAGNSDDHAKNHAFLLDHTGKWKISPAYDLTPSRLGKLPGMRSTAVLGIKKEKVPLKMLLKLADAYEINDANTIIQKVADATRQWGDIAKSVGIPQTVAERYGKRIESIAPRKLLSPKTTTKKM